MIEPPLTEEERAHTCRKNDLTEKCLQNAHHLLQREWDEKRPVRHEMAARAILKITQHAESGDLLCIKKICEEALYS